MRIPVLAGAAAAALLALSFVPASAGPMPGKHYTMNVIGFAQCGKKEAWDDNADCYKGSGDVNSHGHTMFVPLKTAQTEEICNNSDPIYVDDNNVRTTADLLKGVRILVTDGPKMYIEDRDATDGVGKFVLPDGEYHVFAAALGKPGGCMDVDTLICYDDTGGGLTQVDCDANGGNDQYVLVGHIDVDRVKGQKTHWDNVTNELLAEATGSHSDDYFDFLWQLYNDGLRIMQLRFYPINSEE